MPENFFSAVPGFKPDWTLPESVRAWQTTRGRGPLPYGGFNLGGHVGDDPDAVRRNRDQLQSVLPNQPVWLEQVHGTQVVTLTGTGDPVKPVGDAVMTSTPGVVCGIMTADCLPVLLADRLGRVVGAAHAGWRGLLQGVLEALVAQMLAQTPSRASDLSAWLGPAIGPAGVSRGHARCLRQVSGPGAGKMAGRLAGFGVPPFEQSGDSLGDTEWALYLPVG